MSASPLQTLQLKIAYLFMNTDGAFGNDEREKFNQLCDSFNASSDDKKLLSNYTKSVEFRDNCDNSDVVITEIDDLLGFSKQADNIDSARYLFEFAPEFLNKSKVRCAQTLLILVNLLNSEDTYSPPKQKVIQYLAERWNISEELLSAMFDTVNTISMLYNKKLWVLNTDKTPEEKESLCSKIDDDVQKLYNDINLAISTYSF